MPLAGRVRSLRRRAPWFDHLVRAVSRYKRDGGDRLAASVTYYGFLSLFPLLLLVMSVLGFVLASDPERQVRIFRELVDLLPGVGGQISEAMAAVQEHKTSTGVIGLAGLLFSGLGGVDAMRESLRIMWHQDTAAGSFLRRKATDVVIVLGMGVLLLLSLGVSALGAGLTTRLLDEAGVHGSLSKVALQAVALGLALAVDMLLLLYLFTRLSRCDRPFRRIVRGALFGAIGLGILKTVATYYVGRTAANSTALYGTVGVVIGLLVGLNLVARFILFTAAWTVTEAGRDDVAPSESAAGASASSRPRERALAGSAAQRRRSPASGSKE